jgi:hypothetical protein
MKWTVLRRAFVFAVLLPAGIAAANDSTAVLEAGGLRLARDAPVDILEEDLFISADLVEVTYRFRSATGNAVETLVAFPMPLFDFSWVGEGGVGVLADHVAEAMEFELWVDGVPLAPQIEMKALRNGIDITAVLETHGVPFDLLDYTELADYLAQLSPTGRRALQQVDAANWGDGYIEPLWTTQVIYYWRQVFPADTVVQVRHRYRPIVGNWFLYEPDLSDVDRDLFCIGEAEAQGIRNRLKQAPYGAVLGTHLSYILSTGANWNGPIGSFRLTLDKGRPENLVSLCFDGIAKIGPTRFEAVRRDFVPDRELDVLFVSPLQ